MILGKGNSGTAEMQRYFSHIPGTIDFWEMETDLRVAQDELAKFTGRAVIRKAVDHYLSDDFKDTSHEVVLELPEDGWEGMTDKEKGWLYDQLVEFIQHAVTLLGYREYALNNDATHTKTGRMARMDKDTDEWTDKLVDADDRALQRKGQKAVTRLLRFLTAWQFPEFVDDDPYNSTKDLLLWNSELFHRFHPIDHDDRLFMLMLPMNRSVQQDYIAPLFEAERMSDLLGYAQEIGRGEGKGKGDGEDYEKLRGLYDRVGYVVAYLSLSKGYKELPVQLFPETMSRNFWAAGNGAAFIAFRDKIADDTWKEGMRKLQVLMMYLDKLRADETEVPITDDVIVNIDKRMREDNKFVRV